MVAFNYANFYAPLSRSSNWTVSSEVGLEAAKSSLYSQHSMKLELTKHLDKVRDTVTEVDRIVSSHKYLSDRRTVMVMGLLSTIIQHHRSMLHLIKSAGTAGSSWRMVKELEWIEMAQLAISSILLKSFSLKLS
jgi:hypothetical protein